MSNKYQQKEGLKKFYYQPGSHYCAIVAQDRKHVKEIRHKVLDHYLGQLGQTQFGDIDIELCPVDFEDHQKRKPGLMELIHLNS
jgi:hypothetical protein